MPLPGDATLGREATEAMEPIHLPPNLVPYLDALALKQADPESEREGFEAALADIESWIEFESGYTLDDEESGHFENLRVLLESLYAALEQEDRQQQLDQLVPPLYQTVALMERINARRERPRYSSQPAVNDLLVAGAAYLQKRATPEAVMARLERLEAYVRVLRHAYKGARIRFNPEVIQALDTGLEHLRQGMQQAQAHLETGGDPFQDSLASISDGAELMQSLIEWQRQDEQRLAERNRRFAIPLVGASLQNTLDMGRGMPRSQWRRGVKHLLETVIPSLEKYWNQGQLRVFVDPLQRADLLDAISEGIEELKLAVEQLIDEAVPPEQAVEACEAALEHLSDCFLACDQASLPYAHLRGTTAGAYLEVIVGALNQTMPIVAFTELFHETQPPDEWNPIVAAMLDYARDANPDHLFKAGYLLISQFPAPADESHPDNWVCPYCGQVNPVGQVKCAACHSLPKAEAESHDWDG